MKKRDSFIQVLSTIVFALLVIASPLLANATQLLEKPSQEISSKASQNEEKSQEDNSNDSTSRIDQTIVVNGSGGFTSLLPTAAKQLYFEHYLPVVTIGFRKYIQTAIDATLLCYIKNILLFFTAPHAP